MIVISACHSSRLAEILRKHGAKAVIAINSMEKVLEKAAQQFNMIYLENLLEGNKASEAFGTAINNVKSMKPADVAVCCCEHKHKPGCLWKIYEERVDNQKAHELHTAHCLCFESIKVKDTTEISHKGNCKYYEKFASTLRNVDYEKFCEQMDKEGFVKPLPKNPKPEERFLMCCCSSELPHNESQKILKLGDLERIIFQRGQFAEGQEPFELKPDLSKLYLPEDSRPEY